MGRRGKKAGGAEKEFRAALYIRLSREDGDREESDSVANQRALLTDYVRQDETIRDFELFIDDGWSGTDFARPAFQRMLEALRARRLNCVVVKDLSRFGRNYIETGRYLEQEFPLLGVRFISLSDDIDSWARPAQANTILVPFKNLINDEYSRDISQKIRAALDSKRRRGEFIGSHPPYGYRRAEKDRTRLVPDPGAAEVVRRIFAEFLAGRSKTAIARGLNAGGVPSPAAYRSGGTGLWSYSSVDHILRNPVYRGDLVQGRYGNVSYKIQKTRRRPEERWFIVRGTHEALVDPAEFDRAQSLMEADTRADAGGEVHPLAGLVRCAERGRALARRRVRHSYGVYEYDLGPTYKQSHTACTPHSVRVDAVEREVLAAIRDEIRAAVDFSRVASELRSVRREKSSLPALERSLARVMELKRGIYSDWKNGELTREEYTSFKEGYDRQEAELRRQIEAERARPQTDGGEWAKLAALAYPETLERGLAAALLRRVLVHADGSLTIEFRFRREEGAPQA